MGLDSRYNPKEVEPKLQKFWEDEGIYHFNLNSPKPVFSIDVPPRYASGPLHLGHAVHYTHIDFVARYKRMRGFNVFNPLCFDVNGMPIEVNVEKKLGIHMREYDRQKFIELCSEFAEENIEEMKNQFRILGESFDPTIYYQTDAKYYRRITQLTFLQLFKRGLTYKGKAPVNWCTRCETAMADAEVEYGTRETKLNYIKFRIGGEDVIIATTRPEMIPAIQLVAVNPKDTRFKKLVGKMAKPPLFDKEVKVVEDNLVDPEFGSGVVMICTIGDKDDLEWVHRYKLPIEKCIDEKGRMSDICGDYEGMKIGEARKRIIQDLKERGFLVKQESIMQNVGKCWRCGTPIEFLIKEQWFLKILDFKEEVLKASEEMTWFPEFMRVRLKDWVDSLSWDWCISRQRYFATPIPVWECVKCNYVVPAREEQCYVDPTIDDPPVSKCPECGGELKGCEDVFDTWMDSSISPLYNSYWGRDNEKFRKLYPNSLRPQSHDIIRTWAFYTILRCLLTTGEKPFENIMIGGFILAPDGRPMHTSWGNVVNPLDVLKDYNADSLRYFAASCTLGEDAAFRWKEVIHGSKLLGKLWNASRFIGMHIENYKEIDFRMLGYIDKWILGKYNDAIKACTESFDAYEYNKAKALVENFFWHDFCDHYLEMVKYRVYNPEPSAKKGREAAVYTLYHVLLGCLKIMAPILPHITEEIYQNLFKRFEGDSSIHTSSWPAVNEEYEDEEAVEIGEMAKEIISRIRMYKSNKGMSLKKELSKLVIDADEKVMEKIEKVKEDIEGTAKIKVVEFGRVKDGIDIKSLAISMEIVE